MEADIKMFIEECMNSTGTSLDVINNARASKFLDVKRLSKYFMCFMEKMNWRDLYGMIKCMKERIDHSDEDQWRRLKSMEACCRCCDWIGSPEDNALAFFNCYIAHHLKFGEVPSFP